MSNIIDKIQLSGVTYDIGGQGGSGVSVVEVTQAEYDALPSSAKTDTSKMYVITDAQAGDLTNYYTKTETNTLLGGKQDTLVSGTNIKTINNTSILGSGNIDIQGGGKAIEAGRGITVTTGETADTVSLNVIDNYYGTVNLATSDRSVYNKSIMIGRSYIDNQELAIAIGTSQQKIAGGVKIYGMGGIGIGNSVVENGSFGIAIGNNSSAGTSNNQSACVAIGTHAESYGNYATALSRTKVNNESEFGCGKYNVSNTGSTDADNTLFSVGNGTSNNARHNAFEIRQNGDIYLSSGGTDIKLQDYLGGGGSITVDSALSVASTNPVQNQALYSELRISNGGETETTLRFEMGGQDSTNYPSGCTKLKVEVGGSNNYSSITFYNDWNNLGLININNFGSISVDTSSFQGATYEISGTTVIISYSTVTNVTKIQVDSDGNYVFKAVTTGAPTAVKDQVVANTTALGGLKLVKISQSDYENLQNKDNDTLYVILGS